jgi:hypothetical protein
VVKHALCQENPGLPLRTKLVKETVFLPLPGSQPGFCFVSRRTQCEGDCVREVSEGLARPLPLTVICELLGLPEEDWPQFRRWVQALMSVTSLWGAFRFLPGLFRLLGYFKRHFAQCRREPRPGLMTARDLRSSHLSASVVFFYCHGKSYAHRSCFTRTSESQASDGTARLGTLSHRPSRCLLDYSGSRSRRLGYLLVGKTPRYFTWRTKSASESPC